VSEQEIDTAQSELGALEGLFAAPEGAAAWAALKLLRSRGWLDPDARVVIFNTGSGLKYL
jgi:threonine synthase